MSQARASSQPPPSEYPLTAAIIGLLQPAIASPSRRPVSEKARISNADSRAISLMSAPATNALSPAPVRIIAPTSAAIERCSNVIESPRRSRGDGGMDAYPRANRGRWSRTPVGRLLGARVAAGESLNGAAHLVRWQLLGVQHQLRIGPRSGDRDVPDGR